MFSGEGQYGWFYCVVCDQCQGLVFEGVQIIGVLVCGEFGMYVFDFDLVVCGGYGGDERFVVDYILVFECGGFGKD